LALDCALETGVTPPCIGAYVHDVRKAEAMRILIVGARMGGLTAAIALRQVGFDAHVYEQASVLREVEGTLHCRRRFPIHGLA
jgi:ribulose 1,5-bisphosphate synthetase/thiazole synthase